MKKSIVNCSNQLNDLKLLVSQNRTADAKEIYMFENFIKDNQLQLPLKDIESFQEFELRLKNENDRLYSDLVCI